MKKNYRKGTHPLKQQPAIIDCFKVFLPGYSGEEIQRGIDGIRLDSDGAGLYDTAPLPATETNEHGEDVWNLTCLYKWHAKHLAAALSAHTKFISVLKDVFAAARKTGVLDSDNCEDCKRRQEGTVQEAIHEASHPIAHLCFCGLCEGERRIDKVFAANLLGIPVEEIERQYCVSALRAETGLDEPNPFPTPVYENDAPYWLGSDLIRWDSHRLDSIIAQAADAPQNLVDELKKMATARNSMLVKMLDRLQYAETLVKYWSLGQPCDSE